IAKDYLYKQLSIPYKNTKKQPLTKSQKAINTSYAKERIFVEHSIGGMKRYRILADRLRNRTMTLYNLALETVAGLWNFRLKN
ncbi:MAG: transposase family protein, partial [Aureispira sp.]|nr:transposase family protein [Aureispira sp.]